MSKQEKREQMLSVIADWRQSGKTKKLYCEEQGISQATFYYWFSRSKEATGSTGGFIAIDGLSPKREIEIIYPNDVRSKAESDLELLSRLTRLY